MTEYTAFNKQLASLISKCAHSDEGALTELYQLTAANLMAVQVRILGMNTMAERALHDTYTRIWIKSSQYTRASGQPLPWLTSIARNHALNLRRARLVDDSVDTEMDDTAELLTEFADLTFLDNKSDSKFLLARLSGLNARTRDSIVRSYIDGWSLQELSITHDKSVASIQKSIHEGMLSLRGRD